MKRLTLVPVSLLALCMVLVLLPTPAPAQSTTRAQYAPDIDALLLHEGYTANIITIGGLRGLRASQRSYTNSVWSRDMDYAISGYSYVLDDRAMDVMRESLEMFLTRVDEDGIVPETIYLFDQTIYHENRQSWDSMPNLIHGVYVYVAKTGDIDFYRQHRETLHRVGNWMIRLDRDGDGLPESEDYPYGYYDSVENSMMHTYALSRFYQALYELAELDSAIERDGSFWQGYAARLRQAFHRPVAEGGYWVEGQAWPIAWRRTDGRVVRVFETFGVFSALRSGLIAPTDGQRYTDVLAAMHAFLPDLIGGPTPMRLVPGGYPFAALRGGVDPPVPMWMLDSSAPWIVGLAVPAYASVGYTADARAALHAYRAMVARSDPPVVEFAAGDNACYGAADSSDGGRTWDNAGWFLAVYGGHYGLTMTPAALVVEPHPLETIPADGIRNFRYQGASVQLSLDTTSKSYRIQSDTAITVRLRPMGDATSVRVDGAAAQEEVTQRLEPGREYVVVSEGQAPAPPDPLYPRQDGGLYDCAALRALWQRTDMPMAEEVAGLVPRSWMWGPHPLTGGMREPYAEGPGGTRLVQYFDKSRMEVNDPAAPRDQWYVTNGLLVVEMVTGEIQVGNDATVSHPPANIPVAGDPAKDNPTAPTYQTFRTIAYPLNDAPAPLRTGTIVTNVLAKDGTISQQDEFSRYQVVLGTYEQQLGHNIPTVFTDFFQQRGLVYQQGRYVQDQLMDWVFVMGLPISEPYWARVSVGGTTRDVLIQLFERRVLTYTPQNEPDWRVEMGNVGQHYLRWRYGE